MEQILTYILTQIVTKPSDVEIIRKEDDLGTLLEVKLADEDKGIVIGKKGMNIRAIRNIVSIIASREKKRVMIKILD